MAEKVNKAEWYMLGMASGGSANSQAGAKPWNECTCSSNWRNNANDRMMNALSLHFSESKFRSYINWQKNERHCNYVNLFVTNKGNGEGAGYSIWGDQTVRPFSVTVPNDTSRMMLNRINYCVQQGLGVWIWLLSDESSWNSDIIEHRDQFMTDLSNGGFLNPNLITGVCMGLEMNEYFDGRFPERQVRQFHDSLRSKWSGVIGVHHGSNMTTFAKYCDVLFYQVDVIHDTKEKMVENINKAKRSTDKPICAFELDWDPNRDLCQYILSRTEAFSAGNW